MSSPEGAGTTAAELEDWVREEMKLHPDALVTIREKPGTDARCAPVVTEVSIEEPGQEPYSVHIEQALGQLVRIDLIAALAFGGDH